MMWSTFIRTRLGMTMMRSRQHYRTVPTLIQPRLIRPGVMAVTPRRESSPLTPGSTSISALPAIIDAVGDKIEIHMDGGIRTGQDVLKAKALGATGTYIGRAFLYGLGAMGEQGVITALDIIQKELDITMALCGLRDVNDLSRDVLLMPDRWW